MSYDIGYPSPGRGREHYKHGFMVLSNVDEHLSNTDEPKMFGGTRSGKVRESEAGPLDPLP